VVVPTGKDAGALFVRSSIRQLSAVTGMPRLTPVAEHDPGSVFTVTTPGAVIEGVSVSLTVIVNVQMALSLPDSSLPNKLL
jgi:hypothetical protein